MRTRKLLGVGLALLLIAAFAAPVTAEEPKEEENALPLVRVTLFTSGVGFFEHRATIEGEKKVQLTFNAEDVNDLLKSMVVQDLGGGRISTVTYGSRDPVDKALQSFAVDMTGNLSLAQLFEQLRGEEVILETPTKIAGKIISVQARASRVDETTITRDYLNVLTKDGIRSVALETVRSVKLVNQRLDQEMRQALETLSLGRDNRKKTVTLEFLGEGARPVKVGYVQETPVWKTSYRLVLEDEDHAYLQGWAIVENTTNRDWEGVDLRLVSGAPVSFVMNLYDPLYMTRPEVKPELRTGVAPQRYERDMGPREEMEKQAMRRSRKPGASARGAARKSSAKSMLRDSKDAEGKSLDLRRGVRSAAQGAEVGELFEYRVETPVHLGRQRSAMIPIVGSDIQGRKVSIYDAAVHAKHPLNGVQLVNTSGLHLMQGPVTVFDGGAYAGDALLGDLPLGAKRLLTYAMDLDVEVSTESKGQPEELISVKVLKGMLALLHRSRTTTSYVARNDDAVTRRLLIARPIDRRAKLLEPAAPAEKTRGQHRFEMEVPAGGTKVLRVVEERVRSQETRLTNLNSRMIAYYQSSPTVPAPIKAAMAEVLRRKVTLDDLGRQLRLRKKEHDGIVKEQGRIRSNMERLDKGSDLYARYLTKLTKQEDRIEILQKEMKEVEAQAAKAGQALDAYLLDLTIE